MHKHIHHFCDTSFTPYLDYGGVLAVLGLFLTSYFVLSKENLIIFSIRSKWTRSIFIILAIAGSTLVLITPFVKCAEYQLLIQVFSYFLFTLSMFFFWFFATYKKKLFINNSNRFTETTLSVLARNDLSLLSHSLNIIYINLEDIITSLKSSDEELSKNAFSLVEIFLSDKKVVEIIATTDMSFLYKYLHLLEKENVRSTQFSIYSLFRELLFNVNSFLYKHLDKQNGLSLSNNIYKEIFNSKYIYKWNLFQKFEIWSYGDKYENPERLMNVVEKLLTRNIDLYFRGEIESKSINDGFEQIRSMFSGICSELCEYKTENSQDYIFRDKTYLLSRMINFFTQDYKFYSKTHYQDESNKEEFFSSDVVSIENNIDKNKNYDNLHSNIGYSYAYSIIFFLERISSLPKWFDNWHITCEVILFIHSYHYDTHKINYCKLTEDILWDHIYDNVIKGHYPNITSIYVKHVTHHIVNSLQNERDLTNYENRVLSLLYYDMKEKIDSNETMMNKEDSIMVLVPEDIIYKDNQFFRSYKNGKELHLLPKPIENLKVFEDEKILKDSYHISH